MANCVQCGRQLPGFSFGKKLCRWCVQHEAAQRGKDSPYQRVESAPWARRQSSSMAVTQAIFGINVAVFVVMLLSGVSMLSNPSGQDLVRWGANFGPLTVGGSGGDYSLAYLFTAACSTSPSICGAYGISADSPNRFTDI